MTVIINIALAIGKMILVVLVAYLSINVVPVIFYKIDGLYGTIRLKLGYRLYESNSRDSWHTPTNKHNWYKTDTQALEALKGQRYISVVKPEHRCIKSYDRLKKENIID